MIHPRALTCAAALTMLVGAVACSPSGGAQGSAAASPTAAPATPSTTRPVQSPSAAAATAPPAGGVRLAVDPDASTASYHAREQLAGRTVFTDAVGSSKGVSGAITLASGGTVISDQSSIVVDLAALQSDESRRDNFIKNNTLQVSQYPRATFVPREAGGLAWPLPTTGDRDFTLTGDLTVHGVTRPVTWQVTAHFGGADVTGTATTNVNISDFGMAPPKVGPVLGIEDGLALQMDFKTHATS